MDNKVYTVSQAVKLVEVESHVLRFWEEQLGLQIGRSELGHRVYTDEDIKIFLSVKEWKKQGLHLKEMVPLVGSLRGNHGNPLQVSKKKMLDCDAVEKPQGKKKEKKFRQSINKEFLDGPGRFAFREAADLEEKVQQEEEHEVAKHEIDAKKMQNFQEILNRVVGETIAENQSPEGRYKKIDETIRHHQRFRKLVAAAKDEK